MEKCTYCVQRIEAAKIETQKQDRRIQDGEIQTACQQACPTEAISSAISMKSHLGSKLGNRPLHYTLLAELGTEPRTTYAAKLAILTPNRRRCQDRSPCD